LFATNGLPSSANFGGGAIASQGTLIVTNSTFSDNHADGAGGIFNAGTATVTSSTFSNNSSGFNGANVGAAFSNGNPFFSSPARASITNSTFFGNSSLSIYGSVLNGVGSTLAITNSSIVGGGVNVANFGVATLNGTILAGPTSCAPAAPPQFPGVIPITDLGYNISSDDTCGFTAVGSLNNTDPMLDPAGLGSNGGPTQTIALLSGSPAIDAIPLDSCLDQMGNPLNTDQRGFPRPDAGEALCDIGAYEFQDFAGDPSSTNCYGKSISALSHTYRTLNAAASALGFRSMPALQKAIRAFCKA
jgi:hypothetical protein